ncbi:tetratricopeptide repeat protein [Jeongeupia chitinilytica]|uniref:Tetratricopeptide repeat protein n=1 Tax=Jeongeupia chitinilytica TaxID=1041641 RepID=A0ABQ3H1J7_9NEIS|nr:tetratricopeptide repeat protein [Jeongeupia chitinilytica]GHD61741.1 hypothetical protein GCM10007350_16560 [Jeongeupia chitinilytica]
MSLLLQALKRAELQKRQPADAGLSSWEARGPAMTLALQDDEPALADALPAGPAHAGDRSDSDREPGRDAAPLPSDATTGAPLPASPALARAVFAAKPAPRRQGMLIWLGALGAASAVAGAWWLARSQPSATPDATVVALRSTVGGAQVNAAPPPVPTAPAVAAVVTDTRSVAPPSSMPGLPERYEASGPGNEPPLVEVRRSESVERVPAAVEAGFDAYQAGRWQEAEAQYRRALQQDERSRDALLGLAATLAQRGKTAAAIESYQRLAQLYPDDSTVQAGLAALQRDGGERQRARLKQQADSGDAEAAFVLGNRLAAEGRWTEAQAAYFQAYALVPASADYAYNLAVSLDRLQQPRLAADHYRRALSLAGEHPVRFDATAARLRLATLDEVQ